MSKPNWKEWAHTPNVRIWQACALSVNIDPHSMRATSTGWMAGPGHGPFFEDESFPDDDTKTEFDLRVRVLLANLSNREYFSPGILNIGSPGNHGVRLTEFAAWALSVVEWDGLPPELVAMAQKREVLAPANPSTVSGPRLMLRMTKEKVAEHYAQRTLNSIVEQEAASQKQATGDLQKAGAGDLTKRNEWTDNALKQLWNESLAPEMTQKKLAEQYGVTHQSISKQLKRAREKFSTTKKAKKNWLS